MPFDTTSKQNAIDAWTPGHLLTGALTRYAGLSPAAALGVWVAFELAENALARLDVVQRSIAAAGPESPRNVVGDLLANAAGYALVAWWEGRR